MWNKKRYEEVKERCEFDLRNKRKKPYDYMIEYKNMVMSEDYEACKAITEVLKPLNYNTADTHSHIPCLNLSKEVV
jgi:hypothetical protein